LNGESEVSKGQEYVDELGKQMLIIPCNICYMDFVKKECPQLSCEDNFCKNCFSDYTIGLIQ
jgi:hypothetical protein